MNFFDIFRGRMNKKEENIAFYAYYSEIKGKKLFLQFYQ